MRKLQELVPNMDKVELSHLYFSIKYLLLLEKVKIFICFFFAANEHSRHVGLGC
jgi:hypothetical protein